MQTMQGSAAANSTERSCVKYGVAAAGRREGAPWCGSSTRASPVGGVHTRVAQAGPCQAVLGVSSGRGCRAAGARSSFLGRRCRFPGHFCSTDPCAGQVKTKDPFSEGSGGWFYDTPTPTRLHKTNFFSISGSSSRTPLVKKLWNGLQGLHFTF